MKKYGEKNMKYSYSDMKIFDCCLIYLITPPTLSIFSTKVVPHSLRLRQSY